MFEHADRSRFSVKMFRFLVLIIICLCTERVISACTEEFVFKRVSVDRKLIGYLNTTTLDSRLDCSRECQEDKYCTGFSYNNISGRCELYDKVISTAQTEFDSGTVIYNASEVCGPPPNIDNITTSPANQDYLPGYLMRYDCIAGTYQNSSIVCLKDGTWNTSAVSCKSDITGKSCDEAAALGGSVGSELMVKPIATKNTVRVKCEHNDGHYWTVIDTTWVNNTKLQGHAGKQSGVYNVSYTIPLDYISAIADSSTFCTQYMKVICKNSNLMRDNGWRTRDGSLADYFFGGIKGQRNCACNLDNSCYNSLKCNCNSDDTVERQDEGFSTYKDDLPVTAFLNGDTDNDGEKYFVYISSLRCKGISSRRETDYIMLF